MNLSERLKLSRTNRPDEWSMDEYVRQAEELEAEVDCYKKHGFKLSQALASIAEHADLKIGDIISEGAVDYVRSLEQKLSEANAAIRWMTEELVDFTDQAPAYAQADYHKYKKAIETALKESD